MSGSTPWSAGRLSEYGFEPVRFDEMRRGAWDIHERVQDMDVNGVYASLNFPSFLPGFAGQRLQQVTKDRDLALASVRAWNGWHLEVWAGSYPDRIIPCQLPWLLDPELGAKMIHENAGRGFHAITFSENPAMLGFPSIHSGHWDPMMAACAETGTVVNLHIGSSGSSPATTEDAPPDVQGVLFFACAISAAVDWLYSGLPTRFPISRSVYRKVESAGWQGCWIASTTCSAIMRCMAPGRHWVRVALPQRFSRGTSGSAQWRTSRRSSSVTELV